MLGFTNQEVMTLSGMMFLYLLVAILFISPILSIKWKPLQRKRIWLIKLRRWLGVTSGITAFFHFAFWLYAYTSGWQFILNSFKDWYVITGLIALLTILLLTVTSNDYSVRKLKKKWKKLHYLTYALPALVVLHALLALKGWPIDLYLEWIIVFALLLLWRVSLLRFVIGIVLGAAVLAFVFGSISGIGKNEIEENNTTNITTNKERPSLRSIDTSHPDYYDIWWDTARSRNFLPNINYSERAIAWCAETGAHPISIDERPLYCSDGRSGTWKEMK